MKKLLLLLLFTISVNAQIAQPTPYLLCDEPPMIGFETFDLTTKIPEILNGLNPTENTVLFYPSSQDALNNTNAILNPGSYVNVSQFIMTLGVRVTNNLGEHSYVTLTIEVLPIPIANPAILQFCDPTELAIYNLNDAIGQLIPGSAGFTVTFYETQIDAQMGANPVGDGGYIPLINPGTQTLFARVENTQSGCFTVTTLTLNTQNCAPTCPAPTNLAAMMSTSTSTTFSWTSGGANTLWQVIILPLGSPDPLPNANGIFVQTNPYTVTGLNSNTCYAFYVRSICANAPVTGDNSPWAGPLTFCTIDCTNNGLCPESLNLVAFLDSNNNGVKDLGEIDFNDGQFEYQINNSGTPLYGYPNAGNFYIFDSNPTNTYDLSFVVNSNYTSYFNSGSNYTNITLPTGSGSNVYYFPITQLQVLNDLEVQLIPSGAPRPGFTYFNTISYKNKGTQTINSGMVSFTKSPVVSIVNISQSGTNSTASGFNYTFSNLAPNEQRYIYVQMQVPTIPTVSLGDVLTNSAAIEPIAADHFPNNNNASLSQIIIGSYDPNDKAESHGGQIVFEDFTANDYLYYTIRFENTGTANAEFIRVEDVLHADLNENTFEMLNASHTVNTRREGNQLTWHFFDINLPPSSININDGHGYVYFRIKPKAGYAIGDIIPNTASIFFDYNPPIVTNTFNTEFVETLGTDTFEANTILMYPNPASQLLTVSVTNAAENLKEIIFYDIIGKRIKTISSLSDHQTIIDLSDLSKGVYLLEINTGNNFKTIKKLVVQ
ncbi:T9SS type A sorting domain-containing protein [Flavobacterium sp.]|uniref:T9SS type A sorting domain-containing protein n=1 Tax=Flavobacterium sp. TaxID=239 RepID=UPI00391AC3EC